MNQGARMRGALYNKVSYLAQSGEKELMPVNFRVARFLTSAAKLEQCPSDTGAEVAFCGRSNAGKSSAINSLTGQKSLARTSKTPGRTQLINFFDVSEENQRIVDLPGYGYAKVPMSVKEHWHKHLDNYLRHRGCLKGMVLLMDIRHPLKEFDEMMIRWSQESLIPLHILLTKADKLKRGAQQNELFKVRKLIPDFITMQLFSSTQHIGTEELIGILNQWLEQDTQVLEK